MNIALSSVHIATSATAVIELNRISSTQLKSKTNYSNDLLIHIFKTNRLNFTQSKSSTLKKDVLLFKRSKKKS